MREAQPVFIDQNVFNPPCPPTTMATWYQQQQLKFLGNGVADQPRGQRERHGPLAVHPAARGSQQI